MAICFYGDGTILLKKENAKEFVDKFIEEKRIENGLTIPFIIGSYLLIEKKKYNGSSINDCFESFFNNDKYFNRDKPTRKIKETDTNNENVLKEFLNFMEEADLGIALLESTDNFESFKTVTKNGNNTPTRQNCP